MSQSEPDFRMADDYGYILSRGHLATARLNLQHFLWQRILNFTLHPTVKLPASPKIADIATGTAMWALEVAHADPTAKIEGYDIDTTQAPAQAWLPSNVSIAEWDIFKEPPAELIGRYDLVHVRLLVLVLSGVEDRATILRRLFSLLKPGGWLQWEDLDTTRMSVKRVKPELATPALDAIIQMSDSGGRHDWLADLPGLLEREGFEKAEMFFFDDPDKLRRALNDQHLMTMEEFAGGLMKMNKNEAAQQVLDMVRKGYLESLAGAAICYPRLCCVAQKK